MAKVSPEAVADIILNRREVYGVDIDSRIREAANRVRAGVLFELLGRLDDESEGFASHVSTLLSALPGEEVSALIVLGKSDNPGGHGKPEREQPEKPTEYYLRLVFCDENAAYYQFPVFPNLEADYVVGFSRKRAGTVQHIRLVLSCPEALQTFIESCRTNPHFARVEKSTAEEFERAPSNSI